MASPGPSQQTRVVRRDEEWIVDRLQVRPFRDAGNYCRRRRESCAAVGSSRVEPPADTGNIIGQSGRTSSDDQLAHTPKDADD